MEKPNALITPTQGRGTAGNQVFIFTEWRWKIGVERCVAALPGGFDPLDPELQNCRRRFTTRNVSSTGRQPV